MYSFFGLSEERWPLVELQRHEEDQKIATYLNNFCAAIQMADSNVRFVGIADYAGKLCASFYRMGLKPLMTTHQTRQYALQTVFRARTRGGFTPELGEQKYAVTVYKKLIRTTLTIAHPEKEYHNMYLLISFDIGSDYPTILESKIIPYVLENTSTLFEKTQNMTEQYAD
jgi:hypothetical protein